MPLARCESRTLKPYPDPPPGPPGLPWTRCVLAPGHAGDHQGGPLRWADEDIETVKVKWPKAGRRRAEGVGMKAINFGCGGELDFEALECDEVVIKLERISASELRLSMIEDRGVSSMVTFKSASPIETHFETDGVAVVSGEPVLVQ